MKKLLLILPLLLLFMGCEEEADEPSINEILTGTWTVTNMGVFANEDCSGALDYTEWALMQAFGIVMVFEIKNDGTADMNITVFGMTDTETVVWTATEDEICFDGDCVDYILSNNNKTFEFVITEDSYCEDMEDEEVDLTEAECGTAGYDWYEAACYVYTMSK